MTKEQLIAKAKLRIRKTSSDMLDEDVGQFVEVALADLKRIGVHSSYLDEADIYNLVAAVLNNNMGNVKVSAEEVESYDIEECTAILNAYMEFVDELKANPN